MAGLFEVGRPFVIVSEMNGKVIAVHKAEVKPGGHLVNEKPHPDRAPHQLWYMNDAGIIHSKLNGFAMEVNEDPDKVKLQPFTGDARQQWTVAGQRIINKVFCNECLEVKHQLKPNDDIIASKYEGKDRQHWRIEYV